MKAKQESLAKHPLAVEPVYSTPHANSNVGLYEGVITLHRDDGDYKGQGRVQLSWLPSPRVRFNLEVDRAVEADLFVGDSRIELSDHWPTVLIDVEITTTSMFSAHGAAPVSGTISKWQHTPDTPLKYVIFHIPNLRSFTGKPICNNDGACWVGRQNMASTEWKVTIDEVLANHLRNELKETGGYGITHVGLLERKDGDVFSPVDAEAQLDAIYWLLSFSNGRWTGPVLPVGYNADSRLAWHEWSSRRVAAFRNVRSWFSGLVDDVFPQIFQGFACRWFCETWSRAIRIAIYWYVMANAPQGAIENGVILAHVAFETLGWTLFVEDTKSLSADGYNRLNASDKLRLLLNHCEIDLAVPRELSALEAAARAENCHDGPAALASIRNAHVHPSPANRDRLARFGADAEYQAWVLSLHSWN